MAVFNVIHISDLHFGSDPRRANALAFADVQQRWTRREIFGAISRGYRQGTHSPDLARKVAKCLLRNASGQSLLIVSGDLAATGLTADLDAALEFLEGTPSSRVPFITAAGDATLAAGRFPLLVVPGNHDRFVNHFGAAGGRQFDVHFSRYWTQRRERVGRRVLLDHRGSDEKLAFIAADLCLSSDMDAREPVLINRCGQGKATATVVDAIAAETQSVRDDHPGIGVCWVIHFPPTLNGSGAGPSMELLDAHLVLAAARRSGVNLMLSGHIHRSVMLADGDIDICCAGAATYYKEANGNFLHFLEIDARDGVASLTRRRNFEWDETAEEFIER